ncbi:hypothetical protein DOTSEDRAFT_152576 [Lecanosticta acicola]|uniref:Rhodopsin domain-containing protein n=1 Tax=Lecanosticta acicola TaxID=111012 RepID=A0AAI8YYJ4_9PEZI|nr:hypothetical protein DOTSEDRAFT_152576 [Lecanosticta acicola]
MVSGWASPEATLGVCWSFTSIALISVGLRLYTRIAIIRQPGWDDLAVTIAMAFTVVDAVTQCFKIHWGLTRSVKELTEYQFTRMEKSQWVAAWNYFFALGFAKLSIVLQCLRIFGHIPSFKRWASILFSVLVVFTLWSGFQSMFVCWPVAKYWDKTIPGKCLPRLQIWFFNSAFNIVTDFATAVLPIPVIRGLQMPKREKRALMIVLALGGSVCIVTIIRLYSLVALVNTKDPSRDLTQGGIYSLVEAACAIFVSCLPTLKGLLTRYFPAVFASKDDSRDQVLSTPSIELSGSGIKNHTTVTVHSQGSIGRDRAPGWIARKFGGPAAAAAAAARMEMDNESGETCSTNVEHKGIQTDGYHHHHHHHHHHHLHGNGKDIEVVTTVEQVERRRGEGEQRKGNGTGNGNSEEHLVPPRPYERP